MNFDFPIGNTPLLALLPNLSVKIEDTNMTGSVKDRAALAMIFDARQQGVLQPGGTVIEPTSGNMGISLAAISARLGYRCIIVMPETMSIERRKLIRAYGAQVVLTPGEQGMAGAVAKAKELAGQMCDKITASAADLEADCLVTACPLCKYNLAKAGKLPIVYFTELLAEALGVKEGAQ